MTAIIRRFIISPKKNMFKKLAILTSLIISMTAAVAQTTLTTTEQAEMVSAHNTWRGQVATPNLKWSPTLANTAQAWADSLKNNQACKMVHSHADGVGENIFWASPLTYSTGKTELQAVSPTKTATSWGDEKEGLQLFFKYLRSGQNLRALHPSGLEKYDRRGLWQGDLF